MRRSKTIPFQNVMRGQTITFQMTSDNGTANEIVSIPPPTPARPYGGDERDTRGYAAAGRESGTATFFDFSPYFCKIQFLATFPAQP